MSRKRREPETAQIESTTHDGRGIAALEGKKVFVAGALPGETVRFQRRKRRRNFDEAELLEVLEPSADRIEPRCRLRTQEVRRDGTARRKLFTNRRIQWKEPRIGDADANSVETPGI